MVHCLSFQIEVKVKKINKLPLPFQVNRKDIPSQGKKGKESQPIDRSAFIQSANLVG